MQCHYVSPQMEYWDKHLGMVAFAINNTWQESAQETPLFLDRGRHSKTVLNLGLPCKGISQGQHTSDATSGEFLRKVLTNMSHD